jgi:hypothetical protein
MGRGFLDQTLNEQVWIPEKLLDIPKNVDAAVVRVVLFRNLFRPQLERRRLDDGEISLMLELSEEVFSEKTNCR